MSEERKKDHIKLAFDSQVSDQRNFGMVYEPMLAGMDDEIDLSIDLAGKRLKAPLWISSMTGGTASAASINKNLAIAAGKTGIGLGLGSCRPLLESDDRLGDFAIRKHIGDAPLYANLGIAQVECLLEEGKASEISALVEKLEADGLILHVNPLQEYMQPEGDRIRKAPLETLKRLLDVFDKPLIIKEVGQGMGPRSLYELCKLPLAAIEFAAFGGTNFTKLEQTRHKTPESGTKNELSAFAHMGHTASEMVDWLNQIMDKETTLCSRFIISGGVPSMAEGHALRSRLKAPSLIGMAQAYLKRALIDADAVEQFINEQIEALTLASLYLKRSPFEND